MGTRVYDAGVVVAMTAMTVTHRVVDKVSGGRLGRRLVGAPVVWLTLTGRRSGSEQRVPVVAARDGDGARAPYLVAGSRGGTEKTPAWAWNLRGHAERGEPAGLQEGDAHLTVDVIELTGAERDAGFAAMVRVYRGFAGYQRHTDRLIPVFRLTPR
jgi:deazaflavin-dependent oxidoreductase (nitroreductase family)